MESQPSMKRIYLVAAVVLVLGIGASVIGVLGNRGGIRQANVTTLRLNGKLILARGMGSETISRMDLATGEIVPLFLSERSGGIVTAAAASPDNSMLALAYAPPPESGVIQRGYTNLYTLPIDGISEPTLVFDAPDEDVISSPHWSADGTLLYFVRSHRPAEGGSLEITIERIPAGGGEPEVIVSRGSAPALSPDGRYLAYIASEPGTDTDMLFVANIDGSNLHPVAGAETFEVVNNPIFSPDSGAIFFSGDQGESTSTSPAYNNPFRAWGVQIASAHSTSTSDIWRIPVDGGTAERVAEIADEGIIIDFSPDGTYAAFTTTGGLHIMRTNGKNITQIEQAGDFLSVQWVP